MRFAWLSPFVMGWVMGCAAAPPCPCAATTPTPKAPTCPSSTPTAETVAEPAPLPTTCGTLALREARLVAGGKGDNHPELVAVRVRIAPCKDRTPTQAECYPVRVESAELSKKYGPNHPLRLMNDAELALCPPQTKSPPPLEQGGLACGPGKSTCGYGAHSACCGKGESCCAGGAAGNYYCHKGPGPCPALP